MVRVSFEKLLKVFERRFGVSDLKVLDKEIWFTRKLNGHSKDVWAGVTTPELRRDRVRAIINLSMLADEKVGKRQGRTITFREMFLEIYRESL